MEIFHILTLCFLVEAVFCQFQNFIVSHSNQTIFDSNSQFLIDVVNANKLNCMIKCKNNRSCQSVLYDHLLSICKMYSTRQSTYILPQKVNRYQSFNKFYSMELVTSLKGHKNTVSSLIEVKNKSLVSGSADATLKIWDLDSNLLLTNIQNPTSNINDLRILTNGLLVSGSQDGKIKFWNLADGSVQRTIDCTANLYAIEVINGYVACGLTVNVIKVFNILNGGQVASLFPLAQVRALSKVNDKILASGSDDKTIKLWNMTSFDLINTLNGHSNFVSSLITLNNGYLVSGSWDKSIIIWDIQKGIAIKTLNGHSNLVRSLCQYDDDRILSGSDDKNIILWNIKTETMEIITQNNNNAIFSLRMLSNGYLAVGSQDGQIRIWRFKIF